MTTNDALKAHQAMVISLEIENITVSKQLVQLEENLKHAEDLRKLQIKERNLLLTELSDQLIVLRKKLKREQQIRNHVKAHNASINMLDRVVPAKRKVIQNQISIYRKA